MTKMSIEEKEQKPAEKQDYSGLTDLERAIHRGFLSAGVENVPVTIIKETANECKRTQTIANENANAEWSEEDEILRVRTINRLETLNFHGISGKEIRESIAWLKSLRPQPHFKPSEDTLSLVKKVASGEMLTHMEQMAMETLYDDLQKL